MIAPQTMNIVFEQGTPFDYVYTAPISLSGYTAHLHVVTDYVSRTPLLFFTSFSPLAITNATAATTTITATVNSTASLFVGQQLNIVGITGFTTNNPNGSYAVASVINGSSFTYVASMAPTGTYGAGGLITENEELPAFPGASLSISGSTVEITATAEATAAMVFITGVYALSVRSSSGVDTKLLEGDVMVLPGLSY